MKLVTLLLIITLSPTLTKAQTHSCTESIKIIESSYRPTEQVSCNNSSAIVRAKYYNINNKGIVIMYISSGPGDYRGRPYIFCGIPSSRCIDFKYHGLYHSWGEAYHKFIKGYNCNCY